jgi:hypothetical protein
VEIIVCDEEELQRMLVNIATGLCHIFAVVVDEMLEVDTVPHRGVSRSPHCEAGSLAAMDQGDGP